MRSEAAEVLAVTMHQLELTRLDAETVLLPTESGGEATAIRVTVHGVAFPQRALFPELLVGGTRAEMVTLAPDGRSLYGYLRSSPRDGATVTVRYDSSQVGRIRRGFIRSLVRPLPEEC